MDISVVIPLFNEEESLPELHTWIERVMRKNNYTYEIIFIDDGSRDDSWKVIGKIALGDKNVRAIRFQRNYGKSAALHVGFEASEGDVIITMDADLQDSPEEIPSLAEMIRKDGFDLVSGWKKKRNDPLSKTLPTKVYNWATRQMSGIRLHDFNCGLKAYKKDVVKSIELFGEMHRYIPVIAHREGFRNITEKVVAHSARKYGHSKFGMERFVNGLLDLMTITFISRFGKKPMHFFGSIGIMMFFIGLCAFGWIGGHKLLSMMYNAPAKNIADQSVFYIALTAMIIGTQLFLAGFIGELIARSSAARNEYKITEEIRK
ncbi:MAG: glycosyltransferase [Crocinitomicaceae bacterium]|nr:glycosyltransferase [Crocinitomicaceae bacterium]